MWYSCVVQFYLCSPNYILLLAEVKTYALNAKMFFSLISTLCKLLFALDVRWSKNHDLNFVKLFLAKLLWWTK